MVRLFVPISIFLLTFSSNVFAISDEDLGKRCLEVGKLKVASQAKGYGCIIDMNQVVVESVDNRFLNPSSYVWYKAPTECEGHDKIVKMVQYYGGKCDGYAENEEIPISSDLIQKRCYEAGKAKIVEKAKALNCTVDYSKIGYLGLSDNHAWYQVLSKDCDKAGKILVSVKPVEANCPLTLKNAVEAVIVNSAAVINSNQSNEAKGISDKSRGSVIIKTEPSKDSSLPESSSVISK